MKFAVFTLVFLCITFLHAQDVKREFEQRVDAEEMPGASQTYLKNLQIKKRRLRHYLERDGALISYESKFKALGKRYSVEFNQDGMLQDIEIQVDKKDMGPTLDQVEDYLTAHFERFRIEKVQAQHLPDALFNSNNPGAPDAWELIVATKSNSNKLERFEMTFDPKGMFLKSRKIIRRSYEFLLF